MPKDLAAQGAKLEQVSQQLVKIDQDAAPNTCS